MKNLLTKKWTGFVVALLLITIVNSISSIFYTRFDFTAEKRFTLSGVSKKVLGQIPQEVKIDVYLDGDLPAGFRHLRSEIRDMLSDLKAFSGGRLQFAFTNPLEGSEDVKQKNIEVLTSKGVKPTSLTVKKNSGVSQQLIFPTAIVSYGDKEMVVNLLENRVGIAPEEALNNSIQNLEYNFINALSKVTSQGKPLIGFTEGHQELSDLELADGMKGLEEGYIPGRVDLKKISLDDLQQLKVLVIAKPLSPFSESEKYKINTFIRRGGNVIWAIDQSDADLDSLNQTGEHAVLARQLNLDDMLFKYGIRLNYALIEDLNCAQIPISIGNGQLKLLPWAFYPLIVPLSPHPVVKNLEAIRSEFAGSIDTVAAKGIKKEVILSSSPFAKVIELPAMISLQMIDQLTDINSFKHTAVPIAVLLEGVFPDVFNNRPLPPETEKSPLYDAVSAKMLVVADGDIFKNQISPGDRSPFPLGYDQYTQHQYGNKSFLMNAVDYLAGDADLIELRQKEVRLRLLDKVKIENESIFWQFLNVLIPLIVLVGAGVIHYFYRKRKYGMP